MIDTILWWAVIAAEFGAVAFSLAMPRIRRSDLTALLIFALTSDILTQIGKSLLFTAAQHPVEAAILTHGWPARVWYHVETTLMLAWPALLSLAVRRAFVFPGSHPAPATAAIGAWIGMSIGLVIIFPTSSEFTQRVFIAVEALSVALAWLAVWQGWPRAWSRSVVHIALLVMLCFETVVLLLGPFSHDLYRDWNLARVPYLLSFAGVAVLLARDLRRPK